MIQFPPSFFNKNALEKVIILNGNLLGVSLDFIKKN